VVFSTLSFKFERVQQGNYLIKLYKDLNQDRKYSNGSSIKRTFSEPFKYFSDTVKVKPRWPITDVNITW
ncbi:MAG: hypothetical protein N3A61_01720, partial [Ignavibacteria bacterium]|nr:hypothetical protein [Ignavibacteria bacterium]